MISVLLNHARNRLAKRMQYNRIVDEIQALTQRDLADMGADRTDMLRRAYQRYLRQVSTTPEAWRQNRQAIHSIQRPW